MYDPNQFTQSMAPLNMGTAMNVPTGMGGFSAPGMRPQMGMNQDRPDMGPGNNPFSPGYRPQMGMDRDRSDMGPGPRPPDMFGQQSPGMFGQQPFGTLGQLQPQQPPGTFGQAMPQGGQAPLGGAVPGGQYNQAIPQQGALGGGFGFSNPFAPQPAQMPQMQPLPNQMPQIQGFGALGVPPAQPGQTGAMGQGLGSLY